LVQHCALVNTVKLHLYSQTTVHCDKLRWRSPLTSGMTTPPINRGELSYLAPLGSENISAPYFKQCFFRGGRLLPPQSESNTTPPNPKTEITNILFCILNFASIIKFKM